VASGSNPPPLTISRIMNSKTKGDITEISVAKSLIKRGIPISIPFGDNQRYDIVIEIDGNLKKVQCKSARLHGDIIEFNLCSGKVLGKRKGDYKGEIDYFAAYCEELDKTYLISINEVGIRQCSLCLNESKPNNRCKLAKDYEI